MTATALAALSWAHVYRVTSTPLCVGTVIAALAIGCLRELWTADRGSSPIALTALSAVLVLAAFAAVLLRLATLAQ